jgi:hypothetical protein
MAALVTRDNGVRGSVWAALSVFAADSAPLADTQSNQFPDNRSDDRGQLAISAPA